MRLLICAGGTGGGVYPALTVAEILKREGHQLLWAGSQTGMEAELVSRAGIAFEGIPAAGVHGVSLSKVPGNLLKLWKGYTASRKLLKQFKPDALLFTGGYVAVPMAFAARKKASLLFVPDIEPGMALKAIARFASKIAIPVEASRAYFKDQAKLSVTGYPLRHDLMQWTRKDGRRFFGFESSTATLLFLGGSSGARSINNAVLDIAPKLTEKYQVIHLTGKLDWEKVQEASKNFGPRYRAFPYLHEIGAAEAAADLVISRAGASSLGEYPYFGLPAILVPYPYAWRYQRVNADYLIQKGGAILLEDQKLAEGLLSTIDNVLSDPEHLVAMRKSMAALRNGNAAHKISDLVKEVAEARA